MKTMHQLTREIKKNYKTSQHHHVHIDQKFIDIRQPAEKKNSLFKNKNETKMQCVVICNQDFIYSIIICIRLRGRKEAQCWNIHNFFVIFHKKNSIFFSYEYFKPIFRFNLKPFFVLIYLTSRYESTFIKICTEKKCAWIYFCCIVISIDVSFPLFFFLWSLSTFKFFSISNSMYFNERFQRFSLFCVWFRWYCLSVVLNAFRIFMYKFVREFIVC